MIFKDLSLSESSSRCRRDFSAPAARCSTSSHSAVGVPSAESDLSKVNPPDPGELTTRAVGECHAVEIGAHGSMGLAGFSSDGPRKTSSARVSSSAAPQARHQL